MSKLSIEYLYPGGSTLDILIYWWHIRTHKLSAGRAAAMPRIAGNWVIGKGFVRYCRKGSVLATVASVRSVQACAAAMPRMAGYWVIGKGFVRPRT